MRILLLGGTIFLGRHVAAEALARGHALTLYTRGLHGAGLFPDGARKATEPAEVRVPLELIVRGTCGCTHRPETP